jgi:hypothetical protein
MDFINYIYKNINIYYSLVIYDDTNTPTEFVKLLNLNDYPSKIINNIAEIEEIEHNIRIFVIHVDTFNELLFIKNNNIYQYTIIFCINDNCFNSIQNALIDKKPECHENILITKIFI